MEDAAVLCAALPYGKILKKKMKVKCGTHALLEAKVLRARNISDYKTKFDK